MRLKVYLWGQKHEKNNLKKYWNEDIFSQICIEFNKASESWRKKKLLLSIITIEARTE